MNIKPKSSARQRPLHCLNSPISIIAVTLPFVLWGLLLLLPTFDDWVYYSTMYGDDLIADGYLLPVDSYWRPFDYSLGALLRRFPQLFPSLNHVIVLAAHVASSTVLLRLCKLFGLSRRAQFITVTYFYFSPAMLGTVLGIDSPNQACSLLCGLLALLAYTDNTRLPRPAQRIAAWAALTIVATLFKENGLAWALIPPVLSYGFGRCDSRRLVRALAVGVALCCLYLAIRLVLTPENATIKDEYVQMGIARLTRNIAVFLAFTWLPADYVSIIPAQCRNLFVAAATILASLPLLFILAKVAISTLASRSGLALAACIIMAAAPHLITVFTTMHSYAALPLAAMLTGLATDKAVSSGKTGKRMLAWSFCAFMAAAVFTDVHHWLASYRSGLYGHNMAEEIVRQTGKNRPQRVFLIITESRYRKYSSFCVIPSDTFGWGKSVMHLTGFDWPKEITDITIPQSETPKIPAMTRRAIADGYDAVWLAGDNGAKVVATK